MTQAKEGFGRLLDVGELEKAAYDHGFPCRVKVVDCRGNQYSRKLNDSVALCERLSELRRFVLAASWSGRQYKTSVEPPLSLAA